MDSRRFDAPTQVLAAASPRRGLLRLLGGLALGASIARVGLLDSVAKRSKGKQGKKGRKKKKLVPPRTGNGHLLVASRGTRTNTCGKRVSCPACPAGRVCLANGSCALGLRRRQLQQPGRRLLHPPRIPPTPRGIRACIRRVAGCDRVPVVCERTEDCPLG